MNRGRKKPQRTCPICGAELDENDDICPNCGSYVEEPCIDAEADADDC